MSRKGPRLPGTRAANGGRRKGTKTARRALLIAVHLAESPRSAGALTSWFQSLPENGWARGMWSLQPTLDRALDHLQREGYAEQRDTGIGVAWCLTRRGEEWARLEGPHEPDPAPELLGLDLDQVLEEHEHPGDVEAHELVEPPTQRGRGFN